MMENTRNSLGIGTTLNQYKIESILGQGGFGITYLASDTKLEVHVAIKEYFPNAFVARVDGSTVSPNTDANMSQYKWGIDRFLKEARILAKFKHQNIVRVINYFEANNTAYMVMEFEEGQSLSAYMVQKGHFTEGELRALLHPILDGLHEMHKSGIIHRDIKPANIFIRKNKSPVLLDFGAARDAMSKRTQNLTALLTPGYAPIEQYNENASDQGPWTDIYALGAVFYKIISGKTPIPSPQRLSSLYQNKKDSLAPITEIGRDRYSGELLRAIDRAIIINRDERPKTVTDWQKLLERREHARPAATPGSAGQRHRTGVSDDERTVLETKLQPQADSRDQQPTRTITRGVDETMRELPSRTVDPGQLDPATGVREDDGLKTAQKAEKTAAPPTKSTPAPATELDETDDAAAIHQRLQAAQGVKKATPPAGPPPSPPTPSVASGPATEISDESDAARIHDRLRMAQESKKIPAPMRMKRPEVNIEELRKYADPAPVRQSTAVEERPPASKRILAILQSLSLVALALVTVFIALLFLYQTLSNASMFTVMIFLMCLYLATFVCMKAYKSIRKTFP